MSSHLKKELTKSLAVPTFAWHGSRTENMCHFKTKDFCSFIMYPFE